MDIEKLRKEIDEIDRKIIELIHKRMKLALRTMKHKEKVIDKNREIRVMDNIKKISVDKIDPETYGQVFEIIINRCRELQKKQEDL